MCYLLYLPCQTSLEYSTYRNDFQVVSLLQVRNSQQGIISGVHSFPPWKILSTDFMKRVHSSLSSSKWCHSQFFFPQVSNQPILSYKSQSLAEQCLPFSLRPEWGTKNVTRHKVDHRMKNTEIVLIQTSWWMNTFRQKNSIKLLGVGKEKKAPFVHLSGMFAWMKIQNIL